MCGNPLLQFLMRLPLSTGSVLSHLRYRRGTTDTSRWQAPRSEWGGNASKSSSDELRYFQLHALVSNGSTQVFEDSMHLTILKITKQARPPIGLLLRIGTIRPKEKLFGFL